MKKNILKQYEQLRTSLEQKRATIVARLADVEAALGGHRHQQPSPARLPPRHQPQRQ